MRLGRVDGAQATGQHDGLVVAAADAVHVGGDGLLVFAEIAQQVGSAKFVVESRAAQRALGHDAQRAGDMLGLAERHVALLRPELGDGETGQACLGLGAAAGSTFVADFAACAGRRTGEWRDGRGVVMGFDLHQHVVQGATLFVAACTGAIYARG